MLHMAVGHVNQVHQGSKSEYEHALMRLGEVSQAQHVRDQKVAEALSAQLGQLRDEAASSYAQLEQKAQGEGLNMAREYEKLVNELNKKTRENLRLRMDHSSTESAFQ